MAVALVAALTACGAPPPELPTLDLSAHEPAVADAIRARRAAAIAEPSASNLEALADVLFAHRNHTDAAQVYLLAAASPGSERFRCLHLAANSVGEASESESVDLFRRALAVRSDYVATWVKAGIALEELGRAAEAGDCYDAALALQRTPLALVGRGRVEIARGEPRRAIPFLEEARTLDRSVLEAAVALAQAYARLGWDEEAGRMADEAAALDSPSPILDPLMNAVLDTAVSYQGRLESANRAAQSGDLERAFGFIDAAIASLPDRVAGHLAAGTLLAQIGRNDTALSAFDAVLAKDPTNVEGLTRRGGVLASFGRVEEAETALRKAVEISPDSVFARSELAAFLELAHPDESLDLIDSVLAVRPNLRTGHLLRARLMLVAGRLDEAESHVVRVLRRHPTDSGAGTLRAEISRRRSHE